VVSPTSVLEPGQFEQMRSGAAHAKATVLESSSKGNLAGQGRTEEYCRSAQSTRYLAGYVYLFTGIRQN
jgi:hypothetical protein